MNNLETELKKIKQLIAGIENSKNLTEFQSIKLPLQLIQASFELSQCLMSPEIIQQISKEDEDSLDAWVITLSHILPMQNMIINTWLNQLKNLSIPISLVQKLANHHYFLEQIQEKHSRLLQSASQLLAQEEFLENQQQQYLQIQEKIQKLTLIESQLQGINVEALKAEIDQQADRIEPEAKKLAELQQKRFDLNKKIQELEEEKQKLDGEIEYLEIRHQKLTSITSHKTEVLKSLIVGEQPLLEEITTNLDSELQLNRENYRQTWEALQKMIQASEEYYNQNLELQNSFQLHFESNREFSQKLVVDQSKIQQFLTTLEDTLQQLDEELAVAYKLLENAKRKQEFRFGYDPT
ncbi:MAG: hypothetical protein EA365_08900 [Gloeocapsa sp. DLM2.Bin57]|nr:MAG: hypothetical protein EA365_08900 [Gloeocapsa sp. DLM2.Bin57]